MCVRACVRACVRRSSIALESGLRGGDISGRSRVYLVPTHRLEPTLGLRLWRYGTEGVL